MELLVAPQCFLFEGVFSRVWTTSLPVVEICFWPVSTVLLHRASKMNTLSDGTTVNLLLLRR